MRAEFPILRSQVNGKPLAYLDNGASSQMPQPVIDRLVKELTEILGRPDIREKFAKSGLPVVAEGPAAFRERITREVPMYKQIIDSASLKIQ